MKIELNEKLWFGKYKGERLIDVIKNNSNYIKKLYDEYDVELSDEAFNYYKDIKNKSFSEIRQNVIYGEIRNPFS